MYYFGGGVGDWYIFEIDISRSFENNNCDYLILERGCSEDMTTSQKVKVKVAQSCKTLCDLLDYTVHGILQARILEQVAFPFSRGSFKPRSPTLQADSLPAEPPGKPKNTGVGSLSLLQQIFPIQESNRGVLHCRRILYQLSHQGSPRILEWVAYPFSSKSSRSRNRTGVFCIAGGFFTSRATRESHFIHKS